MGEACKTTANSGTAVRETVASLGIMGAQFRALSNSLDHLSSIMVLVGLTWPRLCRKTLASQTADWNFSSQDLCGFLFRKMHTEIFSESWQIKPKWEYSYHFPIDLATNGTLRLTLYVFFLFTLFQIKWKSANSIQIWFDLRISEKISLCLSRNFYLIT